MAIDATHGKLILFGGRNGTTTHNDTWSWDGTDWTQVSTTGPSHRSTVLSSNPATGQLILFGGESGAGYFNDTWTWSGSAWTQLSPATSPATRYYHSIAFDVATGQFILFGGANGSGYLNDTWNWGFSSSVPKVTSISPNSGPVSGGTPVTIVGSNFCAVDNVYFGNNSVSFNVISPNQISVTSPNNPAGAVAVTVTTDGGVSNPGSFTYVAKPTVTAVAPGQGPTNGGTPVTLTGTGFVTGATTVQFGTASATNVSVQSSTQLTATTPPNAAGLISVTVSTAGGISSPNNLFTYVAKPTVTSISPNKGSAKGGTSVVIKGTGFTSARAVNFGTITAKSFTINSSTQITATAPANAAGTVDVTVTTPGGTSSLNPPSDQFTYK
jgi:hypothetical protein